MEGIMNYIDAEQPQLPIEKFAAKYDILLSDGVLCLNPHDLQHAIDIDKPFLALEFSGDNFLDCASKKLISTLKDCNEPTNIVLFLHATSDVSLSEVSSLMDTISTYNTEIIFGYTTADSTNKLIAIVQSVGKTTAYNYIQKAVTG